MRSGRGARGGYHATIYDLTGVRGARRRLMLVVGWWQPKQYHKEEERDENKS
jgi:hypothetical protein